MRRRLRRPPKLFSDISAAVDAGLEVRSSRFDRRSDSSTTSTRPRRALRRRGDHPRPRRDARRGRRLGEQAEGSSFLFDSQVTGPAINYFQQVPGLFWGLLGSFIFVVEASRVQLAWQDPFVADRLFLLKSDHVPGDYGFDPLSLGDGISDEELARHKMGELNNGRLAMIAISGMVGQELVNGLNLLRRHGPRVQAPRRAGGFQGVGTGVQGRAQRG